MNTSVVREFTNELGNAIRITVEGPTSMHENIVTPMEAEQLRSALNEHAAPVDYTLLDNAILGSLWVGPLEAQSLTMSLHAIATPLTTRRRLQSLRKRGLVATKRNGTTSLWELVKKP